jgi:hypothetical protein
MEKEDQQNQNPSDDKFDFYVRRSEKIREMGKGILIGLGILILSVIAVVLSTEWRFFILFAFLYIAIIFYFFYVKKKYVAIGLIFLVTVPPAIIGGCLYLTS